jgi:hypothetical protein
MPRHKRMPRIIEVTGVEIADLVGPERFGMIEQRLYELTKELEALKFRVGRRLDELRRF